MIFTVTWHPDAEDELARIWMAAPDRHAVTEAANRIERLLRHDPERQGEDYHGRRLLFEAPLAVVFRVSPDDRLVQVVQVRRQ